MKLATWNVNSLRARLDHVLRWTAEASPDVLCLQETKVVDGSFPHEALAEAGYTHRAVHGQKTYNGVAILSRRPLHDVQINFTDGEPDEQARIVRATIDGVRVVDVYVPNGAPLNSPKYRYKLDWLQRLTAELRDEAAAHEQLLLCGDLNIAPTDADTHDPFESEGDILCTPPERDAFQALLDVGLTDVWRDAHPFGAEYSWWDYRGQGFRYNKGFRIDHILVTPALATRCQDPHIDRTPREWDTPSDHTPVCVSIGD